MASDQTVWFTCGSLVCSLRDGRERKWADSDGVPPRRWSSIAEDTAGRLWIRSDDKALVRESAGAVFHAARARAEQASRVKSEFVANISHEMRTPLNAVIGFTHLTLQITENPEVGEYLRNVHLSAKGLLGLINDILDFSKMESGRLEIHPVAFALRPFIADIASILGREASRKKLEMKSSVEDSAPGVGVLSAHTSSVERNSFDTQTRGRPGIDAGLLPVPILVTSECSPLIHGRIRLVHARIPLPKRIIHRVVGEGESFRRKWKLIGGIF